MNSSATRPTARTSGGTRTALILCGAVVLAVVLNLIIASIAVAAGAPADYGPLLFPVYAGFSAIGLVAAWLGWRAIARRASSPRRTLAIVVPVALVVSFVPDVALLVLQFIPGTVPGAVVALMAMHVVVAATAVGACLFVEPLPRRS